MTVILAPTGGVTEGAAVTVGAGVIEVRFEVALFAI